jgi:hypothetical protein
MLFVTYLSVTYDPFMLSVIMLNVGRLNGIMLSVVAPINSTGHSAYDHKITNVARL